VRKIFSNDVESAVKNDRTFENGKKEVMIDFLLFILNEY
jgi:hypothetical protein